MTTVTVFISKQGELGHVGRKKYVPLLLYLIFVVSFFFVIL